MAKIISFFNHKGGVGKTTSVHNLAFALADKKQRVLLIDADPQMNLTASMYGLSTSVEYSTDEDSKWSKNCSIYISLSEYLDIHLKNESSDKEKFRVESILRDGGYIDLISGSIDLANDEGDLYQIIKNNNIYTKDIAYKFEKAIRDNKKEYDFVLIDTSPSASSIINALSVMCSDYFITPVSPSFFSLQAVDNLSTVFQNWINLLSSYQTDRGSHGLSLNVQFLGLIVQLAKRFHGGGEKKFTSAAEAWIGEVNTSVKRLQAFLAKKSMSISAPEFQSIFREHVPFVIEKCCDFTPQLRSIAEKEGIPVIYLTQDVCRKHNKTVDINKEKGQYKKSFDSITKSYENISSGLIELDKKMP